VIVIKSLVPNSPAAQQGRINPGDILEGIDDTLVLGYLPDQAAQLLKAEQLKLIFLTPTARLGIDTSSSPAAAPESDAASTPQTPSISRLVKLHLPVCLFLLAKRFVATTTGCRSQANRFFGLRPLYADLVWVLGGSRSRSRKLGAPRL